MNKYFSYFGCHRQLIQSCIFYAHFQFSKYFPFCLFSLLEFHYSFVKASNKVDSVLCVFHNVPRCYTPFVPQPCGDILSIVFYLLQNIKELIVKKRVLSVNLSPKGNHWPKNVNQTKDKVIKLRKAKENVKNGYKIQKKCIGFSWNVFIFHYLLHEMI